MQSEITIVVIVSNVVMAENDFIFAKIKEDKIVPNATLPAVECMSIQKLTQLTITTEISFINAKFLRRVFRF